MCSIPRIGWITICRIVATTPSRIPGTANTKTAFSNFQQGPDACAARSYSNISLPNWSITKRNASKGEDKRVSPVNVVQRTLPKVMNERIKTEPIVALKNALIRKMTRCRDLSMMPTSGLLSNVALSFRRALKKEESRLERVEVKEVGSSSQSPETRSEGRFKAKKAVEEKRALVDKGPLKKK
mmetsp:Transcript_17/g.31  ORF Transcript_17/g.31 Transcript_17/m.31 type:complete len:183 (-) Transcript_17:342-890(-)